MTALAIIAHAPPELIALVIHAQVKLMVLVIDCHAAQIEFASIPKSLSQPAMVLKCTTRHVDKRSSIKLCLAVCLDRATISRRFEFNDFVVPAATTATTIPDSAY
jgi:hypothetical protein